MKKSLTCFIQNLSLQDLFTEHENKGKMKMILAAISTELTPAGVIQSKKMYQTIGAIGEQDTHKVLCFIIQNFVDAIKVKPEMKIGPSEIFELSHDLMKKYTHDSIDDIILALKQARQDGKVFYNSVSSMDIYQIINDYFEHKKPAFFERQAEQMKEQERSQENLILQNIAEHNSELADQLKHLISPLDANPEQKRKILSIYKNRKKRGLAVDSFEAYFNKQQL